MIANLKEHAGKISKTKLFNDDKLLATSSRDKSLFIWDLEKQKRIHSFYQGMGGVNSFDIYYDNNVILSTGQDRKISYWDLRTGNSVVSA
jgi:WD40 repeat protein